MFAPALRRSALGEVRQSPRFLALMLVMLVAAIGYGGRDVSRLRYTTELTGDALGIGVAAAVFAVGLALGGLASGPITDRFDPRRLLVAGMALQGVMSLLTALMLLGGVTSDGAYLATILVDGVFAGACVPALATTQAAMVPTGARGAAEIISILRLGIGVALAWLGRHPDETLRLLRVTGLLGGFTTFSAFSAESLALIERGDLGAALAHTLLHVLGALACAACGVRLMRSFLA